MLLRQRQVHLGDAVAGPLRAAADEQFEEQVGDALARGVPPNAGQVVESQAAVAGDQPGKPQPDLRPLARQLGKRLVRKNAHHGIRQGLCAVSRHRAAGRMKAEHSAGKREVEDLPPPVF